MLRNIVILCFVLLSIELYSQGSANIWYFGSNAGLDFSSGSPEVLIDSEMATLEGCATISNNEGLLQFYTDGLTVYNRNHQIMQNGTGLNGDFSSSQSAMIVPKPGALNSYYVFTVDADGEANGLQYSEVNMNLDNGLGAVTNVKNVQLFTPTSEQLTATKIDQQDAYWVISHKYDSDEFLAYKVDINGVNPTPVISAIGSIVTESNNIGQTKFSHQRNRLATARTGEVQVFDFNNTTGELSNLISLNFIENFYGLEFAPNGKILYASHFDSGLFLGGGVRQFNLFSNNEEEITYTSINLIQYQNALFGALQLAPDGKIYVARVDDVKLDVIENPNEVGLDCDYNTEGVDLQGSISIFGLPTFIQPYFGASFDFCINTNTQFYAEILGDYDSLIWDFGDGVTSTEDNPIHSYDSTGSFEVTLTVFSGSQALVVTKLIQILNETNTYFVDIIQCDDEVSDGFTTFDLSNYRDILLNAINVSSFDETIIDFYMDEAYTNQITSQEFVNTINPQKVYAIVEHVDTGCLYNMEVNLNVTNELLEDIVVNECIDSSLNGITTFNLSQVSNQILSITPVNLSITYYESYDDALEEVTSLPPAYTNSSPYTQTIYARAENGGVCFGIYPVVLNAYDMPNVIESEDLFLCTNSASEMLNLDHGIIDGNPNDYIYNWSTGDTSQQIQVNMLGTYTVSISTGNGCVVNRTINVLPSSIAEIYDIEITGDTDNSKVEVHVSGDGDYVYALDDENGIYQESNIFYNVQPGIYTIYVKDVKANCGIASEDISIIGFPKFFTPNDDSVNDTWELIGNSSQFRITSVVQIFDRYGKLLAVLNEENPKWDGKYNGKLLPTNDYWFVANLTDGRRFVGHFTLKH